MQFLFFKIWLLETFAHASLLLFYPDCSENTAQSLNTWPAAAGEAVKLKLAGKLQSSRCPRGLQDPRFDKRDMKKLERSNWWYERTVSCDPLKAFGDFVRHYEALNFTSAVGTFPEESCRYLINFCVAHNITTTLWGCSSFDFDNIDESASHWISRVLPSYHKIALLSASVLSHFNWNRIMIVTIHEPSWWKLAKEMEFRLNRMMKSVELVYAFDVDYIHDPATVPEQFTRMLRSFPQQVIKSILLLAPAWYTEGSNVTEQILYTVKNVTDFLPNPVAIIQLEHRLPFHEKYTEAAMFPSSNMTIRKELSEVYENVLLIGPSVDGRFYQERQQQEQTWRKAGFDEDKGVEFPFGISPMHAYIEDAILQGAFYEAKYILDREPELSAADYRLKPRLRICGTTGNLTHDAVHERPVSYTMFDMIGRFPKAAFRINDTLNKDTGFFSLYNLTDQQLKWGPLGCPAPDDNCPSGDILMCMLDERGIQGSWVLTSLVGFLVIYFFLHAAAILHRKKNELQQLMKGPNKLMLTYQDVNFSEENSDNSKGGKNNKESKKDKKASRRQKASQGDDEEEEEDRKKKEDEDDEVANMTESSGNLCFLKGDIVFIKKFPTTFEPRQSFKRELKELRDLRHENINTFIGFYAGQTCCGLLMGYCSRACLNQLLTKSEYQLNWDFKFSLIEDLARGMKYLHGSDVKLHGRLKSTNCVVDGRFTCKITDYGLPRLYDAQNMYDEVQENESSEDLLWTAPELLKDEKLRRKGTQKGDVYAFAIIASEIVLRGEPFSNTGYSPKAIISRIRRPPPLLRPSIPTSLCPYQVKSMIKECWDEQPERRLTFSQICDALSKVQKGKKTNIVDNMMKMLEEYSNHLEDIVKARTAELEVEKKKSQELLARMMPVEIAQRLQNGETILPVCYDETTIYFSDICGFTSISAASTPFEVVDLLNDLYTLFDNIIDEYEVYKVETIGDAYMVSSGVPFKIGDRHAPEICMLAMDILSATGSFIMRHMPEVPMKIRIGLHSGPAVAGVVGLAMPRYCLFGDTINTASRMESNGLPSRIHISWSTRECLLKSDEGFQIQERGTVELKGKGVLTTYWLAGKEGYDRPLPKWDPDDAPSHGISLDDYMNGNRPPPPKEPIKQKPFIPSKRKAVKKIETNPEEADQEDNAESNNETINNGLPINLFAVRAGRSRHRRRRRRSPRWKPPSNGDSGYDSSNLLHPGRLLSFFRPATPQKIHPL